MNPESKTNTCGVYVCEGALVSIVIQEQSIISPISQWPPPDALLCNGDRSTSCPETYAQGRKRW